MAGDSHGTRLLWLGLLGLVVLFFFALLFEAIPLETRLQTAVSHRLEQAGYQRVRVDVSGRDVNLSGHVASMRATARAESLAAVIPGVRIVNTNFSLQPVRLPFFQLHRDAGDTPVVHAEFSNSVDASRVDELVRQTSSSSERDILVNPEIGEADWLPVLQQLVEITQDIRFLRLEIGAGSFTVRGALADVASYQQAVGNLTALEARAGLQFANGIGLVAQD